MSSPHAAVAVIGGSGFYEFLDDADRRGRPTPYGDPSAPLAIGTVAGQPVAFLPRHGRGHAYPPHLINYRANLWALRSVGVRQVLAPCAVGGLLPSVAPGDIVVPDQLVDRTSGRVQTYVERGAVHAPFADPYCDRLSTAVAAADPDVKRGGAMVVIEGPRFSTRAESQSYAAQGWTPGQHDRPPRSRARPRAADVLLRRSRWSPTWTPASRPARASGRRRCSRCSPRNIERLKGILADGARRPAVARRLRVLGVGRRRRPDLRGPVKVLLTGAAGFIGGAIAARARRRRPRGRRASTCCCRRRTASPPVVDGPAPARRPRRRRLGRPARRRRRGLPPGRAGRRGRHGGRPAGRTPPTTTSAPPRCSPRWPTRGVRRLVLASSMVVYGEGRYACPSTARSRRRPRSVAALEAGDFDNHCPTCGERAGLGAGRRGRAARPAQLATPPARSPRSTTRPRGPGRRDAAAVALRYHNVYGPGMPRDTPYSGVAAIFRSSLERGEAPRVFEDGGQMRDFVHVADVARANLAAIEAVGRAGDRRVDGVQRLLRLARLDPRRGPARSAAARRPSSRW